MDGNTHGKTGRNHVENDDDGPVVDAEPISTLLDIPADEVSNRIGQGTITTLCETGVDEHQGGFHLRFFHRNCCARIEVDREGRVFYRTFIDFGDRPLPTSLRGPERINAPEQRLSNNRSENIL